MPRPLFACAVALLVLAPLRPVAAAEAGHNFAHWENDIAAYEARDRVSPPPRDAVLFIGSSTILFWTTLAADFPGGPVIDRGFGGSEIIDAAHFADRLVIPLAPRAVFLRSGVNDIHAGKTAAQVFADFQEFVAVVHRGLPAAGIYYISMCPTIARWPEAETNRQLNALVAEFVNRTPYLHYIDTWTMSLDAAGKPRPELFRPDGLHFNAAGYKLLAALVRPYVAEARGKTP